MTSLQESETGTDMSSNIDYSNSIMKRNRAESDFSLVDYYDMSEELEQGQETEEFTLSMSFVDVNDSEGLLNKIITPLVLPCITPRFVPTCTEEMMLSLGKS